jgi:hypothetical protein
MHAERWHHRDGFLMAPSGRTSAAEASVASVTLAVVHGGENSRGAANGSRCYQATIRADTETDFLPEPSADTLSQADRRVVNAAEYIALISVKSTRSLIDCLVDCLID